VNLKNGYVKKMVMKNSLASIVLSVLLVGTGSLLYMAKKANNSLDRDLTNTRSKADSLSTAAGILQNNVSRFARQIDSLSTKNGELEKSVAQANTKLAAREREAWKDRKAVTETAKKYNDLLASQKNRDTQLSNLNAANAQLETENRNLMVQLASSNETNTQLNEQLLAARVTWKDNILVETMRKNGQLNLKGRKVRKIVASLNIQSEMKSPTFKIFDPNGVLLPDQYGLFDVKKINDGPASSSSSTFMKIQLTYLLSKKIGPGIYRIEMLNENKHIGNILVRFR
jgi:hypothetical protein